jgi:fatty acid desaturase
VSLKSASSPPPVVVAAVHQAAARSSRPGALYLAGDWAIIAAAVSVHFLVGGVAVYLIAVVLIGVRMRALGNLLHEAAHVKLFAHPRVNAVAGTVLCAWPLLVNFRRYAELHRMHHRYLWRDDRDPDLALYRLTGTETGSAAVSGFAAFLLRYVLLVIIPVMPWWRLISGWRRPRPATWITPPLLLAAGLLTARALTVGLLLYWLVPWLTTYQMCTFWAELGEHGGLRLAGHHWGSRNWRGNVITRWIIGSHSDDLYHLLHHWFPTVPHHRLQSLDRICREHWPDYAAQARCGGFFLGGPDGVSVLRDIWRGGEWPADVRPDVSEGTGRARPARMA